MYWMINWFWDAMTVVANFHAYQWFNANWAWLAVLHLTGWVVLGEIGNMYTLFWCWRFHSAILMHWMINWLWDVWAWLTIFMSVNDSMLIEHYYTFLWFGSDWIIKQGSKKFDSTEIIIWLIEGRCHTIYIYQYDSVSEYMNIMFYFCGLAFKHMHFNALHVLLAAIWCDCNANFFNCWC